MTHIILLGPLPSFPSSENGSSSSKNEGIATNNTGARGTASSSQQKHRGVAFNKTATRGTIAYKLLPGDKKKINKAHVRMHKDSCKT